MHWLRNTITKFFGNLGVSSFFAQLLSPSAWTKRELLKQFRGYVWSCTRAISDETAGIKWFANRINADGTRLRLPKHEIIDLLENPNPNDTGFTLIEMHDILMSLAGESFWYMPYGEKTKQPKEIYLLRPDLMGVALDEMGMPKGYVLTKEDGTKIPFDPLEIIHHKLPNPQNPSRGMGVVEAGMIYIQTEQGTATWSNSYIHNNARPAGIVSFNGKMSDEDFAKIKRQWDDKFAGVENAGKTAFIRNTEVAFTQVGDGLDKIALETLKNISKEDIMFMFRISKPMMGIVDGVALNNGKTAKRIFLENVIKPRMDRLVNTLNKKLAYRFGENIEIAFESPVPEDLVEKSAYLNAASYMTINEKRELEGLEPVTGGDDVLVPLNLIPLGAASSSQDDVNNDNADVNNNDNKNNNDGKDDSQQDNGDSKDDNNADDQQKMFITVRRKKKECSHHKHLELPVETKENYRIGLYRRQRAWQDKFVDGWNKELERQRKEIVKKIRDQKDIDLSAADFPVLTKTVESWMPDEEKAVEGMKNSIEPLILDLMREQGQEALNLIGAEEQFVITDRVRNYTKGRIDKFVPDSYKILSQKLADSLSEGFVAGESLSELVKRVENVYEAAEGAPAVRIARTETSFASNKAAVEGYKQSGFINQKEWYANPDACEFCQPLDGKIVGIDDNYAELGQTLLGQEGGNYPVDFQSIGEPPAHPHCECTILPVIKNE